MQKSLDRKYRSVLMVLAMAMIAVLFALTYTADVKADTEWKVSDHPTYIGADKPLVLNGDTTIVLDQDAELLNIMNTGHKLTIEEEGSHTLTLNDRGHTIDASDLVIVSGTISATSSRQIAIYASNSLEIKGGSINAKTTDASAAAIDAKNITISGGTVVAEGAKGITGGAGGIRISGNADVTATGNETECWGMGTSSVDGNILISGGKVTAVGKQDSAGISALGDLTISGGTVTATSEGTQSMGILTFGNMTVTGGSVDAKGASGIAVNGPPVSNGGNLSISGSNTVLKATARIYNGVRADVGITINEADGLKILKPAGGEVKPYGTNPTRYYIMVGEEISKEVVIRKPAGQVAKPTFSPEVGTYTEAQNVEISCTTDGAEIYYSTDGTSPTKETGTKYTSPISVSKTTTIKAVAVKEGWIKSSVATAKYTITDSPVAVSGVTVSPKEITLKPGDSKMLTATVKPEEAGNNHVTWNSDKESIAKVDTEGKVTAVDEGEAIITAQTDDGGYTDTCKVIVKKDAPVTEECTITFKANGGKGEMKPQTGDKGETIKLRANDFTRSGYEFKSWNTKEDGSGDKYDNKQSIELKEDLTLYAQWEEGKPEPKPEKDDDDDDDDIHESEPASSNNNNTKVPDGCDELRAKLSAAISEAIATGKEKTVKWDKGTSLPYDVMKMLQDNPKITLEFSYTYKDQYYKVTIPGSRVIANPSIQWYGPVYLYALYGQNQKVTLPAQTSAATGTYTVKSGDTLSAIAKRLKTTLKHLKDVNNIKDADKIKPGMVLKY